MEATGKGAMEFLEYAVSGGLINSNTAGAMRAAVKEVLRAVDGEGWEGTNLTEIDLDDYGERFERLSLGRYKPESLLVYKSRFKNAVGLFMGYLENPSGWRYRPARPSASRPKPQSNGNAPGGKHGKAARILPPQTADTGTTATITYPFPVRKGVVATLTLPADLTTPEAKRLAAFIDSIAVEPTLLLAAPSSVREPDMAADNSA